MFVFFDRNGVVREIINDKAVRQASVNANRIYCYFDEVEPYDAFYVIEWGDLTKTLERSFYENQVEMTVPYNKDRDYKYFKDFKKYKFYYIELDNIATDGVAKATIRIMENQNSLFAQGKVIFNVENSVIKNDEYITQAQYDYLVSLVARNNLEIDKIKYCADKITPISINTVYEPYIEGIDILKIHADFQVSTMTLFAESDNVEDMWYGCGRDVLPNGTPLTSAGFELNYENADIGKVQILVYGNKYGTSFNLKCYATTIENGEEVKELVDTITIPPMEQGVFSYFRFNVYRTGVTKITIVQEEGWLKDRFYIKAIEPFKLSGKGYFEIRQKNGIVSKIDNPDENYLDVVYQYVYNQMEYIKANINSVQENADFVKEAVDFIVPAYEEIKVFEEDLKTRQPEIENNLNEAVDTLTQINQQLDQPNGFARLGADGKLLPSQIPVEKTFDLFRIDNENQLTSLNLANVGDIAFITETIDGKVMSTYNYRLVAEPYNVKSNWVLQATTYSSLSAYAERSGLADNSSMVNGIALKKITLDNYNKLADKTGVYLVVLDGE